MGLVLSLAAGSAHALDFVPTIDFRNDIFSGANYQRSFTATVDGLSVTLSAYVDGDDSARPTLYWDDIDGIGVRYDYETDEIEGSERLSIGLSGTVDLTAIMLSDLFIENGSYAERGAYQIAGDVVGFDAASLAGTPGNKANGEHVVGVPDVAASEIILSAPGMVGNQTHEFSVIGVSYVASADEAADGPAVPEPATAVLLGAGLIVLGVGRRRAR